MITELERIERKKYIGSSDAPSIIGVNPYANAADVYYDKITPPKETSSDPSTNDAIIVGNFCESAVLNWFEKEMGRSFTRNKRIIHPNGIMAANLDGVFDDTKEIVEAKTSGIIQYFDRDEWGEIGTDQVPERVIIQTQHQMAVAGKDYRVAWVPVLLGGVGFRLYKVDRNDEIIEALEQTQINFWNEYVLKKCPPPDVLPSIETLKKIKRVPFKSVGIADGIVHEWQCAKAETKRCEELEDILKRRVLNALGDAEEGISDIGNVTYMEQHKKAYEVKESCARVLRFKKSKALV